ncbi:hypothetical protein D9615_004420 [Tricholomella constricta]|uniref:Uncharacterized protein n=1 Tax=Tricholomella constricta TaxID=117010 RepID=A0A8H5HFB2_9AGAR|nr:hypothetical protein D9615_004420 [Tricholomella constricta]
MALNMFKRVEKRRRKREEEEELGLDEDMKEVLGMHDTDSEESASDSDDSSDGEQGSDDNGGTPEGGAFGEEDLEDFEEESDVEEAEQPVITIREALRDPVYLISLEPVVKACIVCPGKLLKGAKMVDLHRTSNACTAHERRLKLFKALAIKASPKDNAWDVLREQAEKRPTPSLAAPAETSKRAQKRKAHAALRKERREKQKAKVKAKKIATPAEPPPAAEQTGCEVNSQLVEPPKKKPKVASITLAALAPASPPKPPPHTTSANIKSIARSATGRAKAAQARAAVAKSKRTPKVTAS